MARLRFANVANLPAILGGAAERAERDNEKGVGSVYTGGSAQRPLFAGEQLAKQGLHIGEFGERLNDKKHPEAKDFQKYAKQWVDQAQPSPWYSEFFGAPPADPAAGGPEVA